MKMETSYHQQRHAGYSKIASEDEGEEPTVHALDSGASSDIDLGRSDRRGHSVAE